MGKIGKVCYLCGKPGTKEDPLNKDHVPPKSLFYTQKPEIKSNLITISAHRRCNSGKKSDDEYLRLIVLIKASQIHPEAKILWDEKLIGQIRRPEGSGFHKMILDTLKEYQIKTPAGIYLRKEHAIEIDGRRISRIIFKICQGLFYKESQKILPVGINYAVYPMIDGLQNFRKEGEKQNKFSVIHDGVFKYLWVHEEGKIENGYFWLTFYDVLDMMVSIGNKVQKSPNTKKMSEVRVI